MSYLVITFLHSSLRRLASAIWKTLVKSECANLNRNLAYDASFFNNYMATLSLNNTKCQTICRLWTSPLGLKFKLMKGYIMRVKRFTSLWDAQTQLAGRMGNLVRLLDTPDILDLVDLLLFDIPTSEMHF